MDDARARLDEVERLSPGLIRTLRQDLAFRQIHPDLIESISYAVDGIDPDRSALVHVRAFRPH